MDVLTVHVFRVEEGLGNACLLQLPDGTCGIVDWGTEADAPLETALTLAAKGLRFVAASHAHADHVLGLPRLLRECKNRSIPIRKFYYPASTVHKQNADLTEARKAAKAYGVRMSAIAVDDFSAPPGEWSPPYLAWADDRSWDVRVLGPSIIGIADSELKALEAGTVPGNETSLVVLFRFDGQNHRAGLGRALFPGDATPATLKYARATAAQFPHLSIHNQMFLLPHHGSHHNLPEWAGDYAHGVVAVSGRTDSPHHPSKNVLTQISQWNSGNQVFCTSYAQCCRQTYGKRAKASRWVKPGSCFGDLVIRVPRTGPSALQDSSHDGHGRRSFGYCGNI